MTEARNVLGEPLAECCSEPMRPEDVGVRMMCTKVDADFLAFSKTAGNDLSTPMPAFRFAGLKPGDCWRLCAARWKEAFDAGRAPKLRLSATTEATLDLVPLAILRRYAIDC